MARLAIFIFHVTYICCFSAIGSAFSMESTMAEFQQETADERPYEESDYLPYTIEPSIPEIQGDIMQTALMYEPAEKEGQLRLVNGGSMYEGRLEIYHAGRWGTVCDDRFRRAAATVVCRELGMSADNTSVHARAYFGQGIGPIHLDEIYCIGTESRLIDCKSNSWERHDCSHYEDVGVSCNTAMATSTDFTDQAVDVSAYHQSEYLPYSPEPSISEEPIVMSTLVYEQTVIYPHSLEPSISEDSMVMSTLLYDQTEDQIRLVNGRSMYEGRLEIYHAGTWGTICDDAFGTLEATVACKQLGLPYLNARKYPRAKFGSGHGHIHLDQVNCTGWEYRLSDCASNGWGMHDCVHYEDVGVSCQAAEAPSTEVTDQTIDVSPYQQSEYQPYSPHPSIPEEPLLMSSLVYEQTVTHGQLRLVNGRSMYDGRLEIYLEGTWGTICDDDFGIYDATVACRQLGLLSWNVRVYDHAYFGQGNGPIQMDDVNCHGSESRLLFCGHRGRRYHNCGHYEDVGIACLLVSTSPEGSYQTIDVSAYHQTEYLLNSLEPSISDDPMDTSTLMYDPTDSIDTSTTSQFRPATWPATWSRAPIAGFTIHTAGTLIDPYRHGSNHCLRLAYQPRTRNASPGDLKVKFIPRDGWLSHRMLWQNTGEQVMKWFSHNLALYITTAGWIVIDDYNARNIEIAEQTITQGTCDYIET